MKERYPDIQWRDIVGLRNVIVHAYFGLNWDRIWQTVTRDVRPLRTRIAGILQIEYPDQ